MRGSVSFQTFNSVQSVFSEVTTHTGSSGPGFLEQTPNGPTPPRRRHIERIVWRWRADCVTTRVMWSDSTYKQTDGGGGGSSGTAAHEVIVVFTCTVWSIWKCGTVLLVAIIKDKPCNINSLETWAMHSSTLYYIGPLTICFVSCNLAKRSFKFSHLATFIQSDLQERYKTSKESK